MVTLGWIVVLAGLAIVVAFLAHSVATRSVQHVLSAIVERTRVLFKDDARPGGTDHESLVGSVKRLGAMLDHQVTALAHERRLFEAVLECMDDAVVALDNQCTITLFNRSALLLTGEAKSPMGRNIFEILREPALQDLFDATADNRTSEFVLLKSQRRVLANLALLPHDIGWLIVLKDITSLRHLETVRRDFVANVSHELRTPISVISANAETLMNGALDDPEGAKMLTGAIDRNAKRLQQLISDLLDLSRIESGRQAFDYTGSSLREAIERARDAVQLAAGQSHTLIENQVDSSLAVHADKNALHQILVNLMDNAIKYSQDGATVTITAKRVDDKIRINVCDNGPGIDPNQRKRIFERFYRIDPGRSRNMGGTGLGLSIVKHIVETMGGQVGVEPNSPKGSIFWFDLLPLDLLVDSQRR